MYLCFRVFCSNYYKTLESIRIKESSGRKGCIKYRGFFPGMEVLVFYVVKWIMLCILIFICWIFRMLQNVIVTVWQMVKLDQRVKGVFLELKMLNVVLIYGQVKQIISLRFSKRTLITQQRSATSSKLRIKTPEQHSKTKHH